MLWKKDEMMKTGYYQEKGFKLTWSADGENYRWCIQNREGHLVDIGSGCGHDEHVLPTEKNMQDQIKRFFKYSSYAQKAKGELT
jgi:hypothetical protein